MLGINPITADLLLDHAGLEAGDWVAQTAANSAVGTYLIALARRAGLRTVNIVRRREAAQEVLALGGDVAIVSDDDFTDTLEQTLGGERIPLLLTPLGGDVVSRTAPFLQHGATVISYGAVNGAPVAIPPQHLTFGDITVRGFWLNNWRESTPAAQVAARYQRIARLTDEGVLSAPVAATYPIAQIDAAVEHARRDGHAGRQGKVLLTFGAEADS
nr:zinc-binding dehydrogenase [Kineococcus aurantiacus]